MGCIYSKEKILPNSGNKQNINQNYDDISNQHYQGYKSQDNSQNIPTPNYQNNCTDNEFSYGQKISEQNESNFQKDSPRLTEKEQRMVEIAEDNQRIIENIYNSKENTLTIGTSEVIDDEKHDEIECSLEKREPSHQKTWVHVNDYSTIQETIECYFKEEDKQPKICILNFADAYKPGGGYLHGRSPQEETLCRQTLLYPTLIAEQCKEMYEFNKKNHKNTLNYDTMIYSKDVYVIRDDSYQLIERPFKVNIISSPAVDNRKGKVYNSREIMERRIRRIINLAAYENNDILILGAFGCGIFKNDPKDISKIYRKILIEENKKDYFESVWLPVYKSQYILDTFNYGFTPRKNH